MMLICKHTVQIFKAAGHGTHWIISLTLLCFIKSVAKIKQIYYFKISPGRITNFSIDQFFITLLDYFLTHFRVRNCFIKNPGFQSNPISLRRSSQSRSYGPSVNNKPGPSWQNVSHINIQASIPIYYGVTTLLQQCDKLLLFHDNGQDYHCLNFYFNALICYFPLGF